MKFRILILAAAMLATTSQLVGQSFAKVNINNISTFVWNDGRMDYDVKNNKAGFEYWKGTSNYWCYSSGLNWGGYFNSELRVGGTRYSTSLTPGNDQGNYYIFRVRPDFKTAKLNGETNDENKSEEAIRAQYAFDFENWPASVGAPFVDANEDGKYTKGIDRPGFQNAGQTIWYVCNDFNDVVDGIYEQPFKSKRTNIEAQITAWAYTKYELLKGTVFKKYRLINRSKTQTIENMYLGMFCDTDLSQYSTDCYGCDTTLNLGYSYMSPRNNSLANFAALGYTILQGPVINGNGSEFALINGKKISNKRNLGMTSYHTIFLDGSYGIELPPLKISDYYNTLMGLYGILGFLVKDPFTNKPTHFPYSGNPINRTGWYDESDWHTFDTRFQISSGPFNMVPGDTQEVIFAQIVTSSTSRLGSVSYLKYLAKYVKDFYENEMFAKSTTNHNETEIPTHFSLEQNYPNPFNPETTIGYTIPSKVKGETIKVTLKVYDVLGREVATLVDEVKQPGYYNSKFSIRNSQLSSGVYFYILQAGEYISTKKMVLLK